MALDHTYLPYKLFSASLGFALLAASHASAAPTTEPFPFSHKRHASLNVTCVTCHSNATSGERADFPPAEKCMACHVTVAKESESIRHLARLAKDAAIVPEKPVYVLPDFVNFSHAKHSRIDGSCVTCHGTVWASDTVEPVLKMKMKACVDCHKANRAAVTCTTCHENFR